MIRSSSASKKNRLQAGYALVPLNATTRAFLAQFATSLVDLPSDFSAELLPSPTSSKKTKKRASTTPSPTSSKKTKKRASITTHDDKMSAWFASRAPGVNKKKRGAAGLGGQQQSTKTDKLKAPLSVDAGREMTVPRKKAATIARVREESSLLPTRRPKTNKLKAPLSVDAGRKMTVLRKKAATIARVGGHTTDGGVLKRKKKVTTNKLKAPLSVDAGRKMTVPRKKAATIACVRSYFPPHQQQELMKSRFSFDKDDEDTDDYFDRDSDDNDEDVLGEDDNNDNDEDDEDDEDDEPPW